MTSSRPSFARPAWIVAALAAIATPAFADEAAELEALEANVADIEPADYRSFKVVGRGIENRETHSVLQLACVGKRVARDSLERECNVLNFLETGASGEQRLVGKPFFIADGASAKKQLQSQMKRRRLETKALQNSRVMLYTRSLFKKGDGGMRTVVALFGGLALAATGAPVWGLAVGLGVPLVADLVTLPIALYEDIRYGGDKALSGTSSGALRDRAKQQWQVKPMKIRAKRYANLSARLAGEGTDPAYLESLEDQVAQDEAERLAEAEKERAMIEKGLPEVDAPTENLCRIDAVIVKLGRKGTEAGILAGLAPEIPKSLAPELKLKLALANALKPHGFLVDQRALAAGTGGRASTLTFEVDEGARVGELTSIKFRLRVERAGRVVQDQFQAMLSLRFERNKADAKAAELTANFLREGVVPCEPAGGRIETGYGPRRYWHHF